MNLILVIMKKRYSEWNNWEEKPNVEHAFNTQVAHFTGADYHYSWHWKLRIYEQAFPWEALAPASPRPT